MSRERHKVTLVFPDDTERTILVAPEDSIWDAAEAQGVALPSLCLQGWCTTCAGRVLSGNFDPAEALRYYDADRAAGFILLCTARPRSDLRILTHESAAMRENRRAHGLPAPRG